MKWKRIHKTKRLTEAIKAKIAQDSFNKQYNSCCWNKIDAITTKSY